MHRRLPDLLVISELTKCVLNPNQLTLTDSRQVTLKSTNHSLATCMQIIHNIIVQIKSSLNCLGEVIWSLFNRGGV